MTIIKSETKAGALTGQVALVFIMVCLVIYILHISEAITIPFCIAVFLWYLINAIARGLGQLSYQGKRVLSRFFCFLFSIFILTGGLWLAYKLVSSNAADVMHAAPLYQKTFTAVVTDVMQRIPADYRPDPKAIASSLNIGELITMLVRTFTGLAGKTLVVLFYTGFLLYEQRFFARKLHEMIGTKAAEARVQGVLANIDSKIQRYIGVKTFISTITGVLTCLVLLAFKVDFAAFWGVMAFVLNFIPYVGSFVAIAMPVLVALVQYGDPALALLVLGSLGIVHAIFGHGLDPYLTGDNLNLSPIFIISNLAMWGMIWGAPGMFLAIPIMAIAVIVLAQFKRTRWIAVLLSKTGVVD